jgi:membrane protein implicated in regulation of membrane protease activity
VNTLVFWLVMTIVFALAEIATMQLVAIWPAIGGVGALLASSLGASIPVQIAVFILISGLLLAFTRPLTKKFIKIRAEKTNADRLIGKTAIVTEDIDNLSASGAVVISGVTWTARSSDGSLIDKGQQVKVEKIEGSKLIVTKL